MATKTLQKIGQEHYIVYPAYKHIYAKNKLLNKNHLNE